MLPHVLSERAAETLQQNGIKVGLHIAEGVGHGINDTALSHARVSCSKPSSCRCRARQRDDDGLCKPGFERVAEAFKKNFDSNGEIGASVLPDGGRETVVDLGAGSPIRRPARRGPRTR